MEEDQGEPSGGFRAQGRFQMEGGTHERDGLRGKAIRPIVAALPESSNSSGKRSQQDKIPGEHSKEDNSKETELGHWTCCLLTTTKRDEPGSYCVIGRHRDEATVPESLKRLRHSSSSVNS